MRQPFLRTPAGLLLWPVINPLVLVVIIFLGYQIAGNHPIILSVTIGLSIFVMICSKVDQKKELRAAAATNIAAILAAISFAVKLDDWLTFIIGSLAALLLAFSLAKGWEMSKDETDSKEEEWPWLRRWLFLSLVQASSIWWISYQTLKNPDDMSRAWIIEIAAALLSIIIWIMLAMRYWGSESVNKLATTED